MANISYQQIREQLINLNVDLEDKSKICKILEQKSKDERNQLSTIEAAFEEKYQAIIEKEVKRHQEQTDKIAEDISKLIEKKKDLVESCRVLIDTLKEKETDWTFQGRKVNNDFEVSIEQEKKAFRAGQEDRLQKYLLNKAAEVRDATAKAMESDLKRIGLSNEQDLLDLERKFKSEERRLKEAMRSRLQETVEIEERTMKEAWKRNLLARGEAIEMELQSQERAHRQRLRDLSADEDAEIEKQRSQLGNQYLEERKKIELEVSRCQDEWRKKLRDAERDHANDLISMQKDNSEQLRALRSNAAEGRKALEARIRAEVESEIEDREPIFEKGSGQASERDRNEGKRGSDRGGNDDDIDYAGQEERDKRLQAEIRQLQLETVKQERLLRVKIEEEKAFSVSTRNKELEASQRKQRALTEEISQYVVEKEDLLLKLQEENVRNARFSRDLREIKEELASFQSSIKMSVMRAKEYDDKATRLTNTRKQSMRQKEEELKSLLSQLRREDDEAEKTFGERLQNMEREKDRKLDELDGQIKSDVARKDDELQLLEQAVHAEKTKAARLETLIKKRGPNSGNLSVQGPALVQGPGAYAGGRLVSSSSTEGASPVPRCLKVKATAGVTVGVGRGKGKESK